MTTEALDQIYAAVADDAAFARLPLTIASVAGARSCSMLRMDASLMITASAANHFTQAMYDNQKDPEIARLDIWSALGARQDRIGMITDSEEFWDPMSFMRTPYFNECYRAFGDDTVRCLGGIVPAGDGYLALAVHSGLGARSFTRRDQAALTRLTTHVFRMLNLRDRLQSAANARDLLQGALHGVADGVLAVDRYMRIHATNARADQILARGDSLRLSQARLCTRDPSAYDGLQRAVQRAIAGAGDAVPLPRADSVTPYRVLSSPLRDYRLALLLVEDPDAPTPNLSNTLAALYGLTASEAELAALLADGHSPEEAASARGVRMSTVRTQIKALLDKTGARRLLDLVRIVAKAPRRFE